MEHIHIKKSRRRAKLMCSSMIFSPISVRDNNISLQYATIRMQEQQIESPQPSHRNFQHQHRTQHQSKMPKSKLIIAYTVTVCLSCLYLETQHFQYLLNDKKAHYMALLTYFDVFMCLLSYYRTIKIKNTPPKLSKIDQVYTPPLDKFYDYTYSPTYKYCSPCQNHKFPRVHHCSTCQKCQYKMDHHCIWTQTCIGYCNLKCFYLFCFYMCIGVLQFWYFTYRVVSERKQPFMQLVEPGVMILWFFTAFSAFFVGMMILCLIIGHTVMIFTNFRTMDSMKTKTVCPLPFFQKGTKPDHLNLFDRGQIQNIKLFFGQKWYLWLFPTERFIYNDIYPQPMAPHPSPFSLICETDLYDMQLKYKEEMKLLPKRDLLQFFTGKKMKINDQVFLLSRGEKING